MLTLPTLAPEAEATVLNTVLELAAHVPSPRQNVEAEAFVPLLNRLTGRKLAVPVAAPEKTGLAMVFPESVCAAVNSATVSEATAGNVCCWPEFGPIVGELSEPPENAKAPVKVPGATWFGLMRVAASSIDGQNRIASKRSRNESDSASRNRKVNSASLLQKSVSEN